MLVTTSFRLDKEDRKKLKALAKNQKRSMSMVLSILIQAAYLNLKLGEK